MNRTITIRNTKGIKRLDFQFPERNDVYLIVGANGAGKTTLLVCIDRLCNPYAFARGFAHPKNIVGYDEYNNSEIQYNNESVCVSFRKKKWKWSASPRKGNAELLRSFGFTDSVFIKADSKRIDATQDEIENGVISATDPDVIRVMNEIFETTRFRQLKQLKVTHGRGKPSTIFNIIKDGACYYTEKRFSTGELAILHLIQNLKDAEQGSIVLLDEAEIALHPRVQINLLNNLKKVSNEKNLMVLISTHSPTMIKATNPQNILLIDSNNNGNSCVITPCYPARALGRVDFEESSGFDFVFFVEDDAARCFLKKIVNRYMSLCPRHATSSTCIIPVGGYLQTAQMAVNTNDQLLNKSKVFAFLDTDAFDRLKENQPFRDLYESNKGTIRDLTITPEKKYIEILTSKDENIERALKEKLHCEISLLTRDKDFVECQGDNERKVAKNKYDKVIKYCCRTSGDNELLVNDTLVGIVVDSLSDGEIKRIAGPVFNQQEKNYH